MLDRILSVYAMAQVVLVTLRAGSKVLTGLLTKEEVLLDLPLIMPPPETKSSTLFDLTCAFRQGVRLGLQLDEFATTDFHTVAIEATEEEVAVEPYRMSLVPALQAELTATEKPLEEDDDARRIEDPKFNEKDALKPLGKPAFIMQRSIRKHTSQQEKPQLDFDKSWVTEYAMESGQIACIRAYAPLCFATLRSYFGTDDETFRKVLLESGFFCSFQSNSKGSARTGGIFFLTRDGSYIIKTIKRDELRTMLKMMPKYVDFMRENGRRSLLNRFFGLYEVSLQDGKKRHYFVILNSVFPGGARISERFDLKGSTMGRKVSTVEKETLGSRAVLKDLDLAQEVQGAVINGTDEADNDSDDDSLRGQNYGLHVGPAAKAALLSQLRMDVELLRDCSVIDYSLLVGVAIEKSDSRKIVGGKVSDSVRSAIHAALVRSKKCGVDAGRLSMLAGARNEHPATYYFGLIDFLQPFDYKKDLEYRLKGLVYKKATYSCVPPDLYAQRFIEFVDKHVT